MGHRAMQPVPPRPRLLQLDILRGIAILLVLGRHPAVGPDEAGALGFVARPWYRFGWTGVDLFFVLSGFLIGGLLFRELRERGRVDIRRFLIRRGFKIWPSYYLYLAFALCWLAVVAPAVGAGRGGAPTARAIGRAFLPSLLNVQNYAARMPRIHLWSLAVEEHFYLALPLVLWGLTPGVRGRDRRGTPVAGIPVFLVGVILACTAWRCLAVPGPFSYPTHHFPTHLRVDGLAFGVLLAYLHAYYPSWWGLLVRRRGLLLAAGLALIAPMAALALETTPAVPALGFTCLYLGYGAILAAFVASPSGSGRAGRLMQSRPARAMAWMGFYSYPIYLWHIDLASNPATLIARLGPLEGVSRALRWSASMTIYVALAVAAGVVMGRLVERPALRLRDRLFPDRLGVPPLAGPATPPDGTPRGPGKGLVGEPLLTDRPPCKL
jgi:peptidoglycan/LPS O-acetylase OafA/YrhL